VPVAQVQRAVAVVVAAVVAGAEAEVLARLAAAGSVAVTGIEMAM